MDQIDVYSQDKLNELKKDITKTKFVSYGCGYKCLNALLFLFILGVALPMVIIGFEEHITPIFMILLLFFIFLLLLNMYYHYEKIEIARNIYYQRVKITLTNKLNMKIKVLDLPSTSACFRLSRKDLYGYKYILHVFDKLDKNPDTDLIKMNVEKAAPNFYWYFDDIDCFGEYEFNEELEHFIGENMVPGYDILFSSEEKEKDLKIFKSRNFISFIFNSRIKYYITCIILLMYIIFLHIHFLLYNYLYNHENNANNRNKNGEEEVNLYFPITPGLSMIVVPLLIGLFCKYFAHHKKRLVILAKDNVIFIGITSFRKKSYIKHFMFEFDSIEDFVLTRKDCRNATLELKLVGDKIQKICEFTGEKKEHLNFLEKNLKLLIGKNI